MKRPTHFDKDEARQIIGKALSSLRSLREKEGKWNDEITNVLTEEEWEKGSVVVGEGLMCFLYPSVKLRIHDANFKLPNKVIDEDIEALLSFANSGNYHANPYDDTETSFTETAAMLLRIFSHVLSRDSNVSQKFRETYLNRIVESCRSLLKFLEKSASHPSTGTYSWSFTEISDWRSKMERTQPLRLESTYCTSNVLHAFCDAYSFVEPLMAREREDILKIIQGGVLGLLDCYDSDLFFFSKNKQSTEKNVIHSVFALEGLLYCFENLERLETTEFQTNIINSAVKRMIETIGADLNNLASFDQDLTWTFAFQDGKEQRFDILEDRSTLGSIANVLCFSLRYLSPSMIDNAYRMIDSLIQLFYERCDPKTDIWLKKKPRIYYTFRMIEAITNSVRYRTEEEFVLSRRELSQILSKTLSSEDVIRFITEKLIRQKRSLIPESELGGK